MIVGAGAGGGTLAQRLARRGWKVVVLETGPFWDPDQDWVSDEAGSHGLYWTEERIIGGSDPVELGKNNSGRGVGGSMVHYAGYCPRFHPSDFEVRSRDGVGEDWPISYDDLKRDYERLELELPVAGEYWPWGDPHRYPHRPHPIAGGAELARAGARCRLGIEMRVGPVGITNGASGTGRTASTAASACRAARSTPRPRRSSPTSPTRSSTGSRSAPAPWPRGPSRRRDRPRHRRGVLPQRRSSVSSGPTRSPSPATRSRRRGCCSTRPAPGSHTGSRTATIRSAAA